MTKLNNNSIIGIVGAGTMGHGIAQVAATSGHAVKLYDKNGEALEKAREKLEKIHSRLVEKGKIDEKRKVEILENIEYVSDLHAFENCHLVVEAVVENLDIKQSIFQQLETNTKDECVLATNTSSLSVTSIAAACKRPELVIGIHFFNPAFLMPLVEIIPALQTAHETLEQSKALVNSWKKVTVVAKDTPGFIVNRVARPFYGESIRIYEEGIADFATIDAAMKDAGFRMGPFELMDFIGNDVNYKVTETVFEQFFYDPRYRPSFTQKRLFEAKRFGRKSGMGYYDYSEDSEKPKPSDDKDLRKQIVDRVVAMLINEAADALYLNIATREHLDLAMTKGVNYPKGLLKWADEIGIETVLKRLEDLQAEYGEDRYRPSPILRKMVRNNEKFYN